MTKILLSATECGSQRIVEIEDMALQDFQPEQEDVRQIAKQAVRDFVEGAVSGDVMRMAGSLDWLTLGKWDEGGWVRALRGVIRLGSVSLETQNGFLQIYLTVGDSIRGECGNDLVLTDALRVLLPKYRGSAVRLYRGETFYNRSRRTYGAAWTASLEVARHNYAEAGFHRKSRGGSVLLETLAPKEAIICAPFLLDNRFKEDEYVLDRRQLTSVKVIERFS